MRKGKYNKEFLELAHKRSIFHFKEVSESPKCGCFHCQTVFETSEITDWTDEQNESGKTALCPNCGIDSVLSNKLPIDDKGFLNEMNKKYFN